MKERIADFLKAENKSAAQFAEEIGVQPSGISHIMSGRNNPSLDFIVKMLTRYPYISADWLMLGKGNMYREAAQNTGLFDFEASGNDHLSESTAPEKENNSAIRPESTSKTMPINARQEISKAQDLRKAERIVIFYNDSTCQEYFPGEK